jgi:hypothetical protein
MFSTEPDIIPFVTKLRRALAPQIVGVIELALTPGE